MTANIDFPDEPGEDSIEQFLRELEARDRLWERDGRRIRLEAEQRELVGEVQQRMALVTEAEIARATMLQRKHFSRREIERLARNRRDLALVRRYMHGLRSVLYMPQEDGSYALPVDGIGGEALDQYVAERYTRCVFVPQSGWRVKWWPVPDDEDGIELVPVLDPFPLLDSEGRVKEEMVPLHMTVITLCGLKPVPLRRD